MGDLIEGTYAMGKGVVCPGSHSDDESDSDSSIAPGANSGGKDADDDMIDPVLHQSLPGSSIAAAPLAGTSTVLPPSTFSITSSTSYKHTWRSQKKSTSSRIDGMMASIGRLADSMNALDPETPLQSKPMLAPTLNILQLSSQEHKQNAIHALKDDDELSDGEHLHAIKHIRSNTSFIDTILSIHKKSRCTYFIWDDINTQGDNDIVTVWTMF